MENNPSNHNKNRGLNPTRWAQQQSNNPKTKKQSYVSMQQLFIDIFLLFLIKYIYMYICVCVSGAFGMLIEYNRHQLSFRNPDFHKIDCRPHILKTRAHLTEHVFVSWKSENDFVISSSSSPTQCYLIAF